jgi:hypothetical protein
VTRASVIISCSVSSALGALRAAGALVCTAGMLILAR